VVLGVGNQSRMYSIVDIVQSSQIFKIYIYFFKKLLHVFLEVFHDSTSERVGLFQETFGI
jgi:hypothetical protein